MRDVFVAGVGMTAFGRHLDKSHAQLTQWSVSEALEDAGIGAERIQLALYANVVQGFFAGEMSIPGEYALRPLGIQGAQVMHIEAACASATMAFHTAYNYIKAGIVDIALVVGTEKLYSRDRDKKFAVFKQPLDAEEAAKYLKKTEGLLYPIPEGVAVDSVNIMMDAYAAQARLHMQIYGTTQRQIAAVAAKNHSHSVHNPLSQYRNPMSIDEVLAAPQVAWPLTVPMCAPISDGSAAAILCSREILATLSDVKPIKIRGVLSRSGSDRNPENYDQHVTRLVSRELYEATSVSPADIDVAEVHDASASGEIVQAEALGLCKPGQGGWDAEMGNTRLGGRIPINVSGGLVSKGHPLGATGLGQIYELVSQLRGSSGQRQVNGARLALAENSGGFYGVEDGLSALTLLESEK
ncbi:MAG: thiolase family protein [Porticoccaceae bacterium]